MSVAFVLIDVDTSTKIDNVVKINMSRVICFHEGISLIGQVYIGLKIMTFRKYRNSSMERTMHYEFVMFFLKLWSGLSFSVINYLIADFTWTRVLLRFMLMQLKRSVL